MQFEREVLNKLVPEGLPPESLTHPNVRDAAAALENQPLLFRSYLWASAIIQAGLQSDVSLPPRLGHFSAGLTPVQEPIVSLAGLPSPVINGFTFGAYVLILSEREGQLLQTLRVGTVNFPLAVTFGEIDLHGCPPHPNNGSSACWVKSNNSGNAWKTGILTCRHLVAGAGRGTAIALSPSISHSRPRSANLAEIDEGTIDASVLETRPSDWPPGLSPLQVHAPAAPGQAVELEDRAGRRHAGTVLRVFHYGTYAGNLFGQRVIADCHGIKGDSGSLLVDGRTSRGVGIYMGTIPDAHGGREGIFQDLSQAATFFDLTLHR